MSDNIPSSPVPSSSNANTENTRLLDTSTANYSNREAKTKQTVITMTPSLDPQETSSYLYNGGGLSVTTSRYYHSIVTAGQPTIPTQQLTEKIQDILVFTEIKKNQQARAIVEEKKQLARQQQQQYLHQQQQQEPQQKEQPTPVPVQYPSSSSDSSDSDSDSDSGSVRFTLKKKLSEWSIDGSKKKTESGKKALRKRDYAVDALRFATDKWKEKHGWSTGSNNSSSASLLPAPSPTSPITTTVVETVQSNGNGIGIVQQRKKQEFKAIPSSAQSVYDVAKNASVCAVLALLHERRQSSALSTETDVSLQSLALSTLNLGLKVQDTSASHVVLYEMLTNKWMHGKSALEWAVENNSQLILSDSRVQLVIEDLWQSGPNWRQDPNHPSHIWLKSQDGTKPPEPKNFAWYVISHTFVDFLARWPSVRYQTMLGFFTALVYLCFHLATVTNQDYTSDNPFAYEYVYYVLVISDVLLEFYKLFTQPFTYLRKISSYISIITASLLSVAFIVRFFALLVISQIEVEAYFLTVSLALVVVATPLMFFRLFSTASDLNWSLAKTNYILHQCLINSLWVFSLGAFIIFGFWVALAALQFDDISPFTMLRYLLLGALHAPQIGDTISYQSVVAGVLLVAYLFLTVVILGSLLTASFLSTILDINSRIDTVKRDWVINRCLKANPVINAFIPSIATDLIFGTVAWIARVIFKRQTRIIWLEKIRQVFWYIIYSPIIIVVGLFELLSAIFFKWRIVINAFKRPV
ncbi:hypothetical protein INT47_011279 [Mucor saturninus]|uniref:Uncharacterized protein n=1 Tax=Mucor saturninus TaxID=64648 RepID=A0A8H7RM77_9FUNG|nr:hypothetical protein INT47_011279 [Mucor saturninus]